MFLSESVFLYVPCYALSTIGWSQMIGQPYWHEIILTYSLPYLTIVFDHQLNYTEHIDDVLERTSHGVNASS